MARNILQDVANTLPHMIMGERMPFADLEVLAELPDGKLSIDLLTREARHSSTSQVALEIVGHLAAWLGERLANHGFSVGDLVAAHLELTLRTDAVPTVRARAIMFDWICTCELMPREAGPRTGRASGRMWYDRDRRTM
jgi:hypothetical protein